MDVKLRRFDRAEAFLEDVGENLYSRASVNNLMLGICERLVKDPQAYDDPLFIAVRDQPDDLLLAAVMTPPHNLILAEGVDFQLGLIPLINYLWENKIHIPGVLGPVQSAEAFFKRWKIVARLEGKWRCTSGSMSSAMFTCPSFPRGISGWHGWRMLNGLPNGFRRLMLKRLARISLPSLIGRRK